LLGRTRVEIAGAALGFALPRTLVGALSIVVGIGPQTRFDLAFHAALLLGLNGTFVALWRLREHGCVDRTIGQIIGARELRCRGPARILSASP